MRSSLFIPIALAVALLGFAASVEPVEPHGGTFPPSRYNPLRLPWTAEDAWKNLGGNGPGDGTHVGALSWAIDFSSTATAPTNYLLPVKSIGAGDLAYIDMGEFVGLIHAG